jgi:hypothetical protein
MPNAIANTMIASPYRVAAGRPVGASPTTLTSVSLGVVVILARSLELNFHDSDALRAVFTLSRAFLNANSFSAASFRFRRIKSDG